MCYMDIGHWTRVSSVQAKVSCKEAFEKKKTDIEDGYILQICMEISA